MTRIVVDTEELARRSGTYHDLVVECGPSLAGHVIDTLLDVPQAAIGYLSGGSTYLRFQQQVAGLAVDAPGAVARAGGQALTLRGAIWEYEGIEQGNPFLSGLGSIAGFGGDALNQGADAPGVVNNHIQSLRDLPTVRIPDRLIDEGADSITQHTLTAEGQIKVFSIGAELEMTTATYRDGTVRVTIGGQVDGGVGLKKLAKALGLEVGITGAAEMWWDFPDAATAERFKQALALVMGAQVVAGSLGSFLVGGYLRLPPPRGTSGAVGAYGAGAAEAGEVEVEGRVEAVAGVEVEQSETGGSDVKPYVELSVSGEIEADVPFLPAEVVAGGTATARLEMEGGIPSKIELTFDGQVSSETEILGVELGPGGRFVGSVHIELADVWPALSPEARAGLHDPTRSDDLIREVLRLGRDETTASLSLYGGGRTEGELDAALVSAGYTGTHHELLGRTTWP